MLGFMSNLESKTCITLQGGQSSGCKLVVFNFKLPEIQLSKKILRDYFETLIGILKAGDRNKNPEKVWSFTKFP